MAKEREGSINIYGSLQAKTEDGVVAYTDGIVHENEDGTKTSLDQLLKDSGGIIDVDKLPQSGWSGTAVSNEGYVEKVYFNTNLNIEEVTNLLKTLTFPESYPTNILLNTKDGSIGIGVAVEGDINSEALLAITSLDMSTIYWINELGATFIGYTAGWQTFDNPILIDKEISNSTTIEEMEFPTGEENYKLSSLFSTTPFVYEKGDINDKAIYRLKEKKPDKTHLEGALLVSNPETTVNKVIFNNELSVEETVYILSQLTYTNFNGINVNILYSNANTTHVIFVVKFSDTEYNIVYSPSIADESQTVLIFTNLENLGQGWKLKEKEINDVGIAELMGLPIGTENNKLLKVLSMNDNFTEVVDSYKDSYTYWAYKDKWVQLIDGDNFNEEGLTEYIDLGLFVKQTSNNKIYSYKEISEELFNKIFTNKNIVVRLQVQEDVDSYQIIMPYQLYPSVSGTAIVLGSPIQTTYYYCISSTEGINQNNQVDSTNQNLIILSGWYREDTQTYGAGLTFTDVEKFRSDSLHFYTENLNGKLYLRSIYTSNSDIPVSAQPIDQTPTKNSTRLVSSGGVFEALQNIGGGSGSAIVDVDVLPEEPKSDVIYRIQSTDTYKEGTLLVSNPQTTVNTIYFNTDLTIWQTDDILRKLDYVDFNGMSVCPLFSNATGTNVIFVIKNVCSYDIRHSTNIMEQQSTLIYGSLAGGWIEGYDSYDLTESGVVELMGLPIGYDNSKLLNLISMNKTFTTKHYDEYYIYNNIWYKLLDNQNKNDMITYIEIKCNVYNNQTGQFLDVTITEEQFKLAIESNFCVLKIYWQNTPSFFYKVYGGKNNQGILEVSFLGGNLNDKDFRKTSIIYFTSDNLTSTPFSPEEIEIEYTVKEDSYKAVSSGGVFNALQEKQGQIAITENSDGSVDITIPTDGSSAGGGSSGEVTVIDIDDLTNVNSNGEYEVDLSKNGRYLFVNQKNPSHYKRIKFMFGFYKNTDIPKGICCNNSVTQDEARYDGIEGQYIKLESTHEFNNNGYLFKIDDYGVTIFTNIQV